jgi:hypothetical protein
MRLKIIGIAVLGLTTVLAACATLTPEGANVKVVTDGQKEKYCDFLTIVSARQGLGPSKEEDALIQVRNKVASAGGNAMRLVSVNQHWADGATASAEALKCRSF